MFHFDQHLTERIRDAGTSTLPLWIFLASHGMWGFALVIAVSMMLGVGTPIGWLALCIPVMVTHVATLGLQFACRRERPPESRSAIHMWWRTPSFPSAHAAGSMAFAVMISVGLSEVSWFDVWIAVVLVGYAILIGASRLMVGVHYATDVFVGMLLGLFVSIAVVFVLV